MTYVKAKPGESIDDLLKRFKRAVEDSGILADLKKHEFYEKPSAKRKRKKIAAQKRALKQRKPPKPKNVSFKWSKDKTKKLPLKSNYQGKRPFKKTSNYKRGQQ